LSIASFISQHWRGKPVLSSEVIIPLIADTRATKGRTALSCLGTISPLGRTISDEDMAPLRVLRKDVHGE
jgi:hypothetical protein